MRGWLDWAWVARLLWLSKVKFSTVDFFMTRAAEGYQVLVLICPVVAQVDDVVDIQRDVDFAAILATLVA